MKHTVPTGVAHLVAAPQLGGPFPSAPRSLLREPDAGQLDLDRCDRADVRGGSVQDMHRGAPALADVQAPRCESTPIKGAIHREG